MSSASSPGSAHTRAPDSVMIPTDNALAKVEEQLANPPQEIRGNPITAALITWVVGTFTLLLRFLHTTHRNFHDANAEFLACIDTIEEEAARSPSTETCHLSSNIPDVGMSVAEAQARGGTAERRLLRCSKSHARGHRTTECLTTDPASMRKRIAGNQKAQKSARSAATPLRRIYYPC